MIDYGNIGRKLSNYNLIRVDFNPDMGKTFGYSPYLVVLDSIK